MIILDCEQLSDEWFAARTGIPSASHFDRIVTSKGEPSKQARDYMYQLAGERLTGKKEETYTNATMQRGIDLEPEAVAHFELVMNLDVQKVGLCYPDEDKRYSCSPDGLIGEDDGMEGKAPLLHTHISYLLGNKLPTKYVQQVQGSMLVTGRKHWYFHSYYPGLKSLIVKVGRDEKFIAKLKAALDKFCDELEKTVKKLRSL